MNDCDQFCESLSCGGPSLLKIVPSSESKNFSSMVTVTVPEVSPLGSGGLSAVPGSPRVRGEPRKYTVASTPMSKPINRNRIDFFIVRDLSKLWAPAMH